MMIGMVLFWVVIVLGIVWLARGPVDGWRGTQRATPLEILERRFAQGDLSAEEYHARREAITGQPSARPVDKDHPAAT